MKVRKKPILVEAEPYKSGMEDGYFCYEIVSNKFIGYYPKDGPLPRSDRRPAIRTLEGPVEVNENCWILTGVMGERWPVRSDIFNKTYDIIDAWSEYDYTNI